MMKNTIILVSFLAGVVGGMGLSELSNKKKQCDKNETKNESINLNEQDVVDIPKYIVNFEKFNYEKNNNDLIYCMYKLNSDFIQMDYTIQTLC